MKQIVECVPNFSEGRDQQTIDALAESIRTVPGVKLLGIEPDKDYNRSVVTFVGEPQPVVEAACRSTRVAAERIDMRKHQGEHPRLGAVDVVPFIPISGVTMEGCVRLTHEYAERVSREFHIPVYLYEAAASHPDRKNLATIRKGEYEGLAEKLKDPRWKPDYGNPVFNAKSGATVTGARKFLIAYNVNLNTADSAIAQEIALRIRESGRVKKDESGAVVKDAQGESVKIPGTLKAVKAMGVFLQRFNLAQVSINLTDFEVTPPHTAFEEVKKQAKLLGAEVTGSEIVGLAPLAAFHSAGMYYAAKGKTTKPHSDEELVSLAIKRLGLSQLEPFEPQRKIIEYMIS
jgi:glutamate formiminotransferase/formiminotetrahydrofolate cyclodeaminase